MIHHKRWSLRKLDEVEGATAEWVGWYNKRMLMGSLWCFPSAKEKTHSYAFIESNVPF